MKKIALYRGKTIDCDIFKPTNYEQFYSSYSLSGGNVGNKLFNTAAEKYIFNDYTEYKYFLYDEINFIPFLDSSAIDEINNNYDLMIMPQANIFCDTQFHKNLLTMWATGISKIKIPVVVLGVGIQVRFESEIDSLCSAIKAEASTFIEAVYKTGGDFSLRGNYTKLFFEKLGFHDFTVTGCPSLYQNGKNLRLPENKISYEDFKPVINGFHALFYKKDFTNQFIKYKSSVYLDQDECAEILYNKRFFCDNNKVNILRNYTPLEVQLMNEKRLFLFYDLQTRFDFLKSQNFNFSFGARIHGNIMSILNGIPSYLYAIDLRTLELAEILNIPYITSINNLDIYELYLNADYKSFNEKYNELYLKFESFLKKNNVIEKDLDAGFSLFNKKINDIQWTIPEIQNVDNIRMVYEELAKFPSLYDFISRYSYYKQRIISRISRR